jgi:hypothetical protein
MTDTPLSNWSDEQLLGLLMKGKPPTAGERAEDIAKGSVRGAADFAIGTAGLPGDVQGLANVAASKITGKTPEDLQKFSSPAPPMATSSDIQKKVEQWTGPLYEPKLPEGRYARSATASRLRAATGPVKTLPGRIVRMGAVPGLASEYLGDAFSGSKYEVPARVAGGLLAPGAIGRTVNPLPISSERQTMANLLRDEGVPLTAGQVTGRRSLQAAESALGNLPFAGSRLADITGDQSQKFVAAALKRVLPQEDQDWIKAYRVAHPEFKGAADADILAQRSEHGLATPDTIGIGREYAGQQFSTGQKGTVLKFTDKQKDQIDEWAQRILKSGLPKETQDGLFQMAKNYVEAHVTGKAGAPAQMNGDAYLELTQHKSPLSAMGRASGYEAGYANELRDIIEEARKDAAFARGTGGGSMPRRAAYEAVNEARRAYKDVLGIENAAGKGTGGSFSPAQLKTALQSLDRQGYNRGRGDLRDLAEAGKEVMAPYPDSGTAGRLYAMSLPASAATAVYGLGSDNNTVTGSGVAAAVAPPLMGRLLMSRPAQWWLANYGRSTQGARNALGSSERERLARFLATEQATLPYREQQQLPPP